MDTPKNDQNGPRDGKVISLDFARRARAGYIDGDAPPVMAFTEREVAELTQAYNIGHAAGVLHRFDLKQDDINSAFNMFRPANSQPSLYVSRSKMGKLTQYKCWTTYDDYKTVAEDCNFDTFMAAVRGAVRGMNAHYAAKNAPKP